MSHENTCCFSSWREETNQMWHLWLQLFCNKYIKKTSCISSWREKKPIKCDICDYSCTVISTLKKLVASVDEGKKPIKCDIGDYSCSVISTLRKHVASVHEEKKPIKCDIGDYSCSVISTLKNMLHQFMKGVSQSNVTFVITNVHVKATTVRPRDTRPQAARTSTMHIFE